MAKKKSGMDLLRAASAAMSAPKMARKKKAVKAPVGLGSPNQGRWGEQANGSNYGIGLGGKDGGGRADLARGKIGMSFQKGLGPMGNQFAKKGKAKKRKAAKGGASENFQSRGRFAKKGKKQAKGYAHKGHAHKSRKAMKAC